MMTCAHLGDVAAFGFFSVLAICITICTLDARRRKERGKNHDAR